MSIRAILPGNLRGNIVELAAIAMRLDQPDGNPVPVHAVRGLLDPPAGALQMTRDESLQAFVCPDAPTSYPEGGRQYSYDPGHMLCWDCVVGILGQRFYKWWLAERKSPRVNSKSTAPWNMSNTNSYPSQLRIKKIAGGGGNVERRGCALIQRN